MFSLSKESGENAAKYVVNRHPKYFQKDIAEPHIPVSLLFYSFIFPPVERRASF